MHASYGEHITVLLVDDQPIVGEAIRRALAIVPTMQFHYCADPRLAMSVIERVRPTVILQDLSMPGTDGLTLVRMYRANPATEDIPVVVLTMEDEPAVKAAAFEAGASDYMVKLPQTTELIARLRHHALSYITRMKRHEAYRALRESQRLLLAQNLELERLTNVDSLTGISNRRYFDEFTALHWKLAIRDRIDHAILMIDVDDFKSYNDTYGHLAGDLVLRKIGESVKISCQRPVDLAARFGGEEFVVSLTAPLIGAKIVSERIRLAVQGLGLVHKASTVDSVVTVSIGGSSRKPLAGEEYSTLLEAADHALYEAKRAGKNRSVIQSNDVETLAIEA